MTDTMMVGCASVLLAWGLLGCDTEPEGGTAPQSSVTNVAAKPPLPPPAKDRPWTSEHPTNLPALPPPGWVKDEAQLDKSRGVLLAAGRGENAGNQPKLALEAAKREAADKLASWLEERKLPAAKSEATRIAQTYIGPDGRAYVQLELELPAQP
jgi:hypothetical protein